ncbi:MAG: biotin/lipoyl-binding protein [Dehalococcoidia bacterium]|nr:biotin/lipoyl-binding protein [Dehalococcoidia bacterium]
MLKKLLIANRGEIAIRVARAAARLGIETVAVYSEDDAECLHIRKADHARALDGVGAAAYLDGAQLIRAAIESGCDAVHPGYGFLSENAEFAGRVRAAGLVFVGPSVEVLARFGDKVQARALASEVGVPVLRGLDHSPSIDEARGFFGSLGEGGAVIVKAASGGGGRGMRVVREAEELEEALERCRSEALAAFGNGEVYLEEYLAPARHIEVQVVGDGTRVMHLWERDCSVQRRRQKLIEIAPAPGLPAELRTQLLEAATQLAGRAGLDSLSTIEFLVSAGEGPGRFAFIEANARLQVEHTVTEELLDVDLVEAQLRLAGGESLADIGLAAPPNLPSAFAVQVRVNLETVRADGSVVPASGTLEEFAPPLGRDVRVDTHGYRGYRPSQRFDSLLAKVIVSTDGAEFATAAAHVHRALSEFQVAGIASNLPLAMAIVRHPVFTSGHATTEFLERSLDELLRQSHDLPTRYFGTGDTQDKSQLVGTRVDTRDPLALFGLYDSSKRVEVRSTLFDDEDDATTGDVRAPLQGTVVAVRVAEGDTVAAGEPLVILDAMKMEHTVAARCAGTVERIHVSLGDTVAENSLLIAITPSHDDADGNAVTDPLAGIDLDAFRPDLAEVERRRSFTLDPARTEAIEKHRKVAHRSARENIDDLVDPDSFVEYGQLALEGYGTGPDLEELLRKSPADGFVCGVGTVNGDQFGPQARCAVLSYDYTVYAGTQGGINHHKHDRMFRLAEQWKLPVIFFTEGGGGRSRGPSGVKSAHSGMRTTDTFRLLGRLSGLVPLVAVSAGRNFAGSAAILGPCDVVIATRDANIGMGGPAVIEGGGLGVYRPEEIGPIDVMARNGVVDIVVKDEAEGVAVAKKYVSYFQGRTEPGEAPDQRRLRHLIPENRRQAYDIRTVIETIADKDSVLELRRYFGRTFVTAFIRIGGRPIGVVANNPAVLGGAIDVDGSDKAARFMQLCDAFGIPILSLCDTPGMMVGPEAEEAAQVKHCSRLFVVGCNLSVPFMMIVLRKCYGLGGLAMGAGNLETPSFVVSWPTGEFAGMNLEGQIKLAYRNELLAIADLEERTRRYEELLAAAYDRTSAITVAGLFDLDDVIDPATSRRWVERTLDMGAFQDPRPAKRRPCVDTW